jgi:uncharacterized protein (DUF39 family)
VFSRTYEEINDRLRRGKAVVVTAEEVIGIVAEAGVARATRQIDVVTTATFAPMCSSGAFLNFGHSDPPIRMTQVCLNDVPAYAGVAAVDCYLGATEPARSRPEYGGAHVIQALVDREPVCLEASSPGTDCYPRTSCLAQVTLHELNQAYLFNPRNCYQNYPAAANTSSHELHTYMGTLLPDLGNVAYCSAGELSPLLNDPYYRCIGVGTRIFLGGGAGLVAWEGTQHNPDQQRTARGVPVGGAGTLAVIGDLKEMSSRYIRAVYFPGYGATLMVGIGVPIPVLDEEVMSAAAVSNAEIFTNVYDYSVGRRSRPSLGTVSYAELRSGEVELAGRKVRTTALSSLARAREIAAVLGGWLRAGRLMLCPPVEALPRLGGLRQLAAAPEAPR